MIVSNDTIKLRPPYTITGTIISFVAQISEKIGEINAIHLYKPAPELRKKNRIRAIQGSLAIEGNTLSKEQVTALLENKRVAGPQKDILEVKNAINVYNDPERFHPYRLADMEKAHALLMHGLVAQPGKFRTTNAGIIKGSKLEHIAPAGSMVKALMKQLFHYLKTDKELLLIKSCVFHYELEFIHPFTDGNGRMGRLWQTLLLMQQYPVFEFLPIESVIKQRQTEYYRKLSESDKKGSSTPFIEFMLEIILETLTELLQAQNRTLTTEDRMLLFKESAADSWFSRKDYLYHFKSISAPTASRDLQWAVKTGLLEKSGKQRMTIYRFTNC